MTLFLSLWLWGLRYSTNKPERMRDWLLKEFLFLCRSCRHFTLTPSLVEMNVINVIQSSTVKLDSFLPRTSHLPDSSYDGGLELGPTDRAKLRAYQTPLSNLIPRLTNRIETWKGTSHPDTSEDFALVLIIRILNQRWKIFFFNFGT